MVCDCCSLCTRLTIRTFRDEDSIEDLQRKRTFVPPLTTLMAVIAGIMVVQWNNPMSTNVISNWLYFITLAVLNINCHIFGRVTAGLISAASIPFTVGVILGDWAGQAALGMPGWPLGVIVVDALLVAGAPMQASVRVVMMILFWVALERLEHGVRFGLYEASALGGELPMPKACDCATPPCPKGFAPVMGFGMNAIIFICDYVITRGFSEGLRREKELSDASVMTAEELSVLLASYATDDAEALVLDAGVGESLPPRLRDAMLQLVRNLRGYRPYLPQSCLPQECASDDEAADGAAGDAVDGGPPAFEVLVSTCASETMRSVTMPLSSMKGRAWDAAASLRVSPRTRKRSLAPQRRSVITVESSRASSGGPPTVRSGRRRSADRRGLDRCSAASSPQARGRAAAGRAAQSAREQLQRKHATLVAMNLRGYLRPALSADPMSLGHFHQEVLEQALARVAAHKGLTEALSSDRLLSSVNGAKPAALHRAGGVRLAWALAEPADAAGRSPARAMHGMAAQFVVPPLGPTLLPTLWQSLDDGKDSPRDESPRSARPLAVSCGVCAGELWCGALGSDVVRRYSFVGAAAAWVHAMERAATAWRAAAVVSHGARADAETAFAFRLRDCASMAKPSHRDGTPQHMWEILGRHAEQAADEWMYQLDSLADADPWRDYNRAKLAYYSGDFDAAARIAAGAPAAAPPPLVAAQLAALRDAAAARPRRATSLLHDMWLVPPPLGGAPAPVLEPVVALEPVGLLCDDAGSLHSLPRSPPPRLLRLGS